jgi:hypothetical protein
VSTTHSSVARYSTRFFCSGVNSGIGHEANNELR